MEKVRSMFSSVGVRQELWEEVVNISCYLLNRSSLMDLVNETPYHAWDGENPSLTHLRVFGCESFVHIPKEKIIKLYGDSTKCIFIRYKDGVKIYKLWNPMTRKEIYSRVVIFMEVRGTSNDEEVKIEKEKEK